MSVVPLFYPFFFFFFSLSNPQWLTNLVSKSFDNGGDYLFLFLGWGLSGSEVALEHPAKTDTGCELAKNLKYKLCSYEI